MGRFLEKVAVVRRAFTTFGYLPLSTLLCGRRWPFPRARRPGRRLLADGIAAVVNDKVITYVQINQQVAETEKLLRQNLQGEELFERVKEAKLNVLRALIERELIIQDFKNAGRLHSRHLHQRTDQRHHPRANTAATAWPSSRRSMSGA